MPKSTEPGFRATPAWAPRAAIWAVWPDDDAAKTSLAAALRALAEPVGLLVRPPDMPDATARLDGVDARFHEAWSEQPARAAGPVFVARPGEVAAAVFAGASLAATIAELAEAIELRHDLALEGDAIDTDGAGTALATRQWLIGPRNKGQDARDLAGALHAAFDVEHVIWIDRGIGDGKVTDVARFVAPGVVVCMEPAVGDPDRDALREVIATLHTARDAGGRRLEIFTIPAPVHASYCGFAFGATKVIIPQVRQATDDRALDRLAPLFPGRVLTPLEGTSFHASLLGQPR